MSAYYNEIDPYAAQWLRNLIAAGHIADGVVDERSIVDVRPVELRGFTQCHFFAGIGVWSYALRRAGWPDERPIWTGSCPCQPFSAAGKRRGADDDRHLWPAWFDLIRERRPGVIVGEQVASRDGLAWFDALQADMEGEGYPCGAVDTCAAGVGAPHIRQRLYWMAYADREPVRGTGQGDADCPPQSRAREGIQRERRGRNAFDCVDDAPDGSPLPGPVNGFWRDADWLYCRDGLWRPVEPGTFPLAHGYPNRVGRLRAYGNAINAAQATAFCRAVMMVHAMEGER